MCNGNENKDDRIYTKDELASMVKLLVESSLQGWEAQRAQAVHRTSLLHLSNIADRGKVFLLNGMDLTLALLDAGLALPAALIKGKIIEPSLNHSSLMEMLHGKTPRDSGRRSHDQGACLE